jgi:hypothetical protein
LTFQEGPSFIIGQYVFYMVGVLEQYCWKIRQNLLTLIFLQ